MTISLYNHSWRARVAFAAMIDAHEDFTECPTGSTLDRMLGDTHPYHRMWCKIINWYDKMSFEGVPLKELSESEFLSFVQRAPGLGFTIDGRQIPGTAVMQKVSAWSRRGWNRYEEKRQQKVDLAKKVGIIGGLILSGGVL